MIRAVLDSTVLVSAFLKPVTGGASSDLLRAAADGAYEMFFSRAILDETRRVLLTTERIRKRYLYPNSAVEEYLRGIAQLGKSVTPRAVIRVVRDPADDMAVACAVAAAAGYIITRDNDLLSLKCYNKVWVITPEEFHGILREG